METIQEENQKKLLECKEDDLPMRDAGPWAAEKLDYLNRYLNIFTTSMRRQNWKGLNYIDLFAGSGKCRIISHKICLGSPLIALTLANPFSELFYVENEKMVLSTLKKRCNSSPYADRIHFFEGDCNFLVNKILNHINTVDNFSRKGKWEQSMNLAFLDPEGLELEWRTVALLGQMKKMDLIIYYPQMGITREIKKSYKIASDTKLDVFFGCRDWRDIYENYQLKRIHHLHRNLIDLYKSNLKKLGYIVDNENEPLMRNRKQAPLYRLIFASKHNLAIKFWNEVNKHDVYGQKKLTLW